jgi:hypothetical protein
MMNNQGYLTKINSILKYNFKYKIINKFNIHLFKALSDYKYDLNDSMLYDLIEIIYHSYYRSYDYLIISIKSLHNKYINYSSVERANMLFFCNSYLFPNNKLLINYSEITKTPVDISIFAYIIAISCNIKLLKDDKIVATNYNMLITKLLKNINETNRIPNYLKKEILFFINKNNIEIVV